MSFIYFGDCEYKDLKKEDGFEFDLIDNINDLNHIVIEIICKPTYKFEKLFKSYKPIKTFIDFKYNHYRYSATLDTISYTTVIDSISVKPLTNGCCKYILIISACSKYVLIMEEGNIYKNEDLLNNTFDIEI